MPALTTSPWQAAVDRFSQKSVVGSKLRTADWANPGATVSWKSEAGTFTTLDKAALSAIALAVGAHVQACFARESELASEIEAVTSATGAGEDISDITFDVGNLKVTDGITTGYPFQVVGGAVRVRNLTLVPADIAGLGSDPRRRPTGIQTRSRNRRRVRRCDDRRNGRQNINGNMAEI